MNIRIRNVSYSELTLFRSLIRIHTYDLHRHCSPAFSLEDISTIIFKSASASLECVSLSQVEIHDTKIAIVIKVVDENGAIETELAVIGTS